MAGSSLLLLIDDIATLLDDVSVMTKVAAKKTAGVLGDDLALNAQQVSGIKADRELPVVWAVAKGSLVNKAILVPAALLISAVANWAIMPLLMLGGLYLCFEGAEKMAHSLFHPKAEDDEHHARLVEAVKDEDVDIVSYEKEKIKGAVRTDFILSAEIIVITLGTVAAASFGRQVAVLVGISLLMTAGVYGLVAGIVKLDDMGLYLSNTASKLKQALGRLLLAAAPWLMKTLSVLGTLAMFLVGGGIIVHGLPFLHHGIENMAGQLGWAHSIAAAILNALAGLAAGSIVLVVVSGVSRLRNSFKRTSS
jgi:predicted DNA repair protein MutK